MADTKTETKTKRLKALRPLGPEMTGLPQERVEAGEEFDAPVSDATYTADLLVKGKYAEAA